MLNTGVPSRSKSFREKARERFGLSRNKSRSVDVQRPSTLSSIRSKIQTVSATFKDSVSERREDDCPEVQTRKGRSSRIKVPTTSYTVRPSDTVFSIAAQFNVTPAEVSALNRLSHSSELFPDQVIRVPDLDALAKLELERKEREAEEERERQLQAAANNLATSPRSGPGIAARVTPTSPSSQASSLHASISLEETPALSAEESVRERQFVKSEHARLITDGEGCVSGTLIITPQTLMFDPSVHDRLVQERGQSYFQWQIELRQVRTVAVYSDPRAMRLMVGETAKLDNPNLSEAEMRMELNEEAQRFVETKAGSVSSVEGKDEEGKEKEAVSGVEEVKKETPNGEPVKAEVAEETEDSKEAEEEEKEKTEVAQEVIGEERQEAEGASGSSEEKDEAAKEAVREEEEVGEEKETKEEEKKTKEEEEKKETREEKEKKEEDGDGPEKEREKEQETEEKEGGAGTTEEFGDNEGFDLRSPQPSGTRLDYLCILYKPCDPARRGYACPPASPAASDQPRLPDRGQHWFTLPHEKNKELLAFLKDSRPEELDSGMPSGAMAVSPAASGGVVNAVASAAGSAASAAAAPSATGESFFVLQENHYVPASDADPRVQRLATIRQQSLDWELINREEVYGATGSQLASGASIDEELLIPELIGEPKVLQYFMLKDIVANLPSRAEGCLYMELAYSTHKHGFSLQSLYRKCRRETEDKPCVLLIRSQTCSPDSCFGAVLSSHLRVSDHFYGTGETYLMRWTPTFEKYPWSGNNNYIIKGENKSLMIGSSSGRVALYIDEGLFRGRSQTCDTFTHPTSLSPDGVEDFVIENLEVWDFK